MNIAGCQVLGLHVQSTCEYRQDCSADWIHQQLWLGAIFVYQMCRAGGLGESLNKVMALFASNNQHTRTSDAMGTPLPHQST